MKLSKFFKKKVFLRNLTVFSRKQYSEVAEASKEETPIDKWKHLQNLDKNETFLIELKKFIESHHKYANTERPVTHTWDIPESMGHILFNFHNVQSLELLVVFAKQYEGLIDTATFFNKFHQIADLKDCNRDLFTVILPLVKKNMVKFDRNSINEIYNGAMACAKLNIADKEFWTIFEDKIVNEKLYRYLSVEQGARLVHQLNKSERASVVFMKLMELEFVKHRKALHIKKKLLSLVKEAYSNNIQYQGSELLMAALEDANIEITKTNKLI